MLQHLAPPPSVQENTTTVRTLANPLTDNDPLYHLRPTTGAPQTREERHAAAPSPAPSVQENTTTVRIKYLIGTFKIFAIQYNIDISFTIR